MKIRKILKESLISFAVLGMIGGSLNSNIANAKHRRYHYRSARHYRIHRHVRRRRGRAYHRRSTRRRSPRKARKSNYRAKRIKHAKYMYTPYYDNNGGKHYARVQITKIVHPIKGHTDANSTQYYFRTNNKGFIHSTGGMKTGIDWAPDFFNRIPKTHHHNTKHESTTDLQQNMANDTFNDINADRENNGLLPYEASNTLTNIAAQRAYQLASNFSHHNSDGSNAYETLYHKYGYHPSWLNNGYSYDGENIAESELGPVGHEGHSDSYNNHNGHDMAYQCENEMMNHDGPRWGHRANILSNHFRKMGVGTYSPDGQNFYLAEDFSS